MRKALVIVSKTINSKSLEYYSNLLKKEKIYFVTPKHSSDLINYEGVNFMNDSFFLDRQDCNLINKTSRPNWYYQQFLKYSIVLKLEYDLIHIVDGDSFVKKDLLFSEDISFSQKKVENNYYEFINLLFNKKSNYSNRNYITNQMCFNKKKLLCLINEIESRDKNWIDIICNELIKYDNLWFSEYQVYADYVLSNEYSKEKEIKIFRRFDFINDTLNSGLKKYAILAEEPHHNNDFLRKSRAKLYYFLNLNLG